MKITHNSASKRTTNAAQEINMAHQQCLAEDNSKRRTAETAQAYVRDISAANAKRRQVSNNTNNSCHGLINSGATSNVVILGISPAKGFHLPGTINVHYSPRKFPKSNYFTTYKNQLHGNKLCILASIQQSLHQISLAGRASPEHNGGACKRKQNKNTISDLYSAAIQIVQLRRQSYEKESVNKLHFKLRLNIQVSDIPGESKK